MTDVFELYYSFFTKLAQHGYGIPTKIILDKHEYNRLLAHISSSTHTDDSIISAAYLNGMLNLSTMQGPITFVRE